ncbi:MAG TPA: GMC family oxidoreductase N-terminal domain-containing protein, partial [Myxococcota bacterium]
TGDARPSRGLTQRDSEIYDQLYMDRGGRSTSDLSIAVLQGRALGGGGIINASDVVPMHDDTLAYWQKRFGLTDYSAAALAPFAAQALTDLHANRIDESQLNRANKLLRIGAEKLGVRGEVMMHNRVGCAGLGTCLIGCPLGAKQNPRMVSIPLAVTAGASFLCRARAVRIDDATSETKRVLVRALDAKGYREQGEFTIRARTVILAANAVGSAHLAIRSGIGNAHVGKNLSLQPQVPVVARFADDVIAYRGIPQAYAITEHERVDPERGLWGFRIEAIMGTPGIVASLLPRTGSASLEAMSQYNKSAASLVLVPDTPAGTVTSNRNGKVIIDYAHADDHKARLREGAALAARAYLAAGAVEVEIPTHRPTLVHSEAELPRIGEIAFDPCTVPLLSAHQQGGMRAAGSERDGACAPNGALYGCKGVFCFDSGLFPSSASSHTQTPIITIARWLTTRFLSEARS